MICRYDPAKAPDAQEWLLLDEGERLDIVMRYHKRQRVELPNLWLHAAVHAIVENQLAEAVPATKAALDRLLGEGLVRHDAIHAIGSVLADHMHSLLRGEGGAELSNEDLYRELGKLTAESWRRSAQSD